MKNEANRVITQRVGISMKKGVPMLILFKVIVIVLTICVSPISSFCLTKDGVTLPDSIVSSTSAQLVLNGIGTRKATIFGFKVYVAGLYLDSKTQDPSTILQSSSEKQIHMQFTRDVHAADIRDAWESGFKNNNKDSDQFKSDLESLLLSTQDIQEGQKIIFITSTRGVEVIYPSGSKFTNNNPSFGKALLQIWLGDNPPNEELKDGLLGNP